METQGLFTKQKLVKVVSLKPNQINHKIDDTIVSMLNGQMTGKCCNEGYIKKNSIKLEQKTMGRIELGEGSGNTIYNVSIVCDLCVPVDGNIYSCIVENKNKSGIVGYSKEGNSKPLYILIPNDYISEKYDVDSINIDDTIKIKVLGKRYKFNDTFIQIIAEIVEV